MRQITRMSINDMVEKGKKNYFNDVSMIKASDFYDYMVRVISLFDDKDYEYQVFNVTDDRLPYQKPISVFVMFNTKKIDKSHFGVIRTKGLIEYIASEVKNNKDFVYFEIKDEYISLLDNDLNVNLTSFIIKLFPYLEDIVYDVVKYKTSNMKSSVGIDYNYLYNCVKTDYEKEIVDRRKFLLEESSRVSFLDNIKNNELTHIIHVVENSNLDEGTKKILIYTIDKYRS